jgi:hypothetical protein
MRAFGESPQHRELAVSPAAALISSHEAPQDIEQDPLGCALAVSAGIVIGLSVGWLAIGDGQVHSNALDVVLLAGTILTAIGTLVLAGATYNLARRTSDTGRRRTRGSGLRLALWATPQSGVAQS